MAFFDFIADPLKRLFRPITGGGVTSKKAHAQDVPKIGFTGKTRDDPTEAHVSRTAPAHRPPVRRTSTDPAFLQPAVQPRPERFEAPLVPTTPATPTTLEDFTEMSPERIGNRMGMVANTFQAMYGFDAPESTVMAIATNPGIGEDAIGGMFSGTPLASSKIAQLAITAAGPIGMLQEFEGGREATKGFTDFAKMAVEPWAKLFVGAAFAGASLGTKARTAVDRARGIESEEPDFESTFQAILGEKFVKESINPKDVAENLAFAGFDVLTAKLGGFALRPLAKAAGPALKFAQKGVQKGLKVLGAGAGLAASAELVRQANEGELGAEDIALGIIAGLGVLATGSLLGDMAAPIISRIKDSGLQEAVTRSLLTLSEERGSLILPGGENVGKLVRVQDRDNIGRIISVDEETGLAKILFRNKAEGTQAIKEIPLDQVQVMSGKEGRKVLGRQTVEEAAADPDKFRRRNFKLRKTIVDSYTAFKDLISVEGVKLTDDANPYQAKTLYAGRLSQRKELVVEGAKSIDKDIIVTARKLRQDKVADVEDLDLQREVYDLLIDRHAPERNALHGDGAAGISTAEAVARRRETESLPHADEIIRLADRIQEMNQETLKVLHEGQVIDNKTFRTLTETYKDHIPLQRVLEGDDIGKVLTGEAGFSVKGTGLKKVTKGGSEREVKDILSSVVYNLEDAIVRTEKNRVGLATLRFARNNKQLGLFKEVKPKAEGTFFSGEMMLTDPGSSNLVLTVRERGKPVFLETTDPEIAQAMRGVGIEHLGQFMNVVGTFTRTLASLATRFNPEFFMANIVRDSQEAAVYLSAQKSVGALGAIRTLTRIPESILATTKHGLGIEGADTALFRQFKLDGGTTGGMGLSTRKQVDINMDKMRRLNRSNPRKAAQKMVGFIDGVNEVFENSTRFSVYKESLARGATRGEAAAMAKRASLDFNQKGTAGPVINSLYMFSNASIQGSAKMLNSLKNPKTAALTLGTIGAAVYGTNQHNEQIDPKWREKLSDVIRAGNMVWLLPPAEDGSMRYVTIPVSWGLRPWKVAFDVAYDVADGHNTRGWDDAAMRIGAATWDGYNPTGGSDPLQAVIPTFGDVPADIIRNVAWHGGMIRPDWMEDLPRSEQKFEDVGDTFIGRNVEKMTTALSDKNIIEINPHDFIYAFEQYTSGAGKAAARVINTGKAIQEREAPEIQNIPFVNRFLKEQDLERSQAVLAGREQRDLIGSLQDASADQRKEIIEKHMEGQFPSQREDTLFKLRDGGFDTSGISTTAMNTPVKFIDESSKKALLRAKFSAVDYGPILQIVNNETDIARIKGSEIQATDLVDGVQTVARKSAQSRSLLASQSNKNMGKAWKSYFRIVDRFNNGIEKAFEDGKETNDIGERYEEFSEAKFKKAVGRLAKKNPGFLNQEEIVGSNAIQILGKPYRTESEIRNQKINDEGWELQNEVSSRLTLRRENLNNWAKVARNGVKNKNILSQISAIKDQESQNITADREAFNKHMATTYPDVTVKTEAAIQREARAMAYANGLEDSDVSEDQQTPWQIWKEIKTTIRKQRLEAIGRGKLALEIAGFKRLETRERHKRFDIPPRVSIKSPDAALVREAELQAEARLMKEFPSFAYEFELVRGFSPKKVVGE